MMDWCVLFVIFYLLWCSNHMKKLSGRWEQIAKSLRKLSKLRADCGILNHTESEKVYQLSQQSFYMNMNLQVLS